MDCSPPGSSVHGILQVRILEWVAIPFSRGSLQSRDRTKVSRIAGRFLTGWAIREVFNTSIHPHIHQSIFCDAVQSCRQQYISHLNTSTCIELARVYAYLFNVNFTYSEMHRLYNMYSCVYWRLSLIMILRFIHVADCISSLILFNAELCCILWIYYSLSIFLLMEM